MEVEKMDVDEGDETGRRSGLPVRSEIIIPQADYNTLVVYRSIFDQNTAAALATPGIPNEDDDAFYEKLFRKAGILFSPEKFEEKMMDMLQIGRGELLEIIFQSMSDAEIIAAVRECFKSVYIPVIYRGQDTKAIILGLDLNYRSEPTGNLQIVIAAMYRGGRMGYVEETVPFENLFNGTEMIK